MHQVRRVRYIVEGIIGTAALQMLSDNHVLVIVLAIAFITFVALHPTLFANRPIIHEVCTTAVIHTFFFHPLDSLASLLVSFYLCHPIHII